MEIVLLGNQYYNLAQNHHYSINFEHNFLLKRKELLKKQSFEENKFFSFCNFKYF